MQEQTALPAEDRRVPAGEALQERREVIAPQREEPVKHGVKRGVHEHDVLGQRQHGGQLDAVVAVHPHQRHDEVGRLAHQEPRHHRQRHGDDPSLRRRHQAPPHGHPRRPRRLVLLRGCPWRAVAGVLGARADPDDVDDVGVAVDHDGGGHEEDVGGEEGEVDLALPLLSVALAGAATAPDPVPLLRDLKTQRTVVMVLMLMLMMLMVVVVMMVMMMVMMMTTTTMKILMMTTMIMMVVAVVLLLLLLLRVIMMIMMMMTTTTR